MEETKTELQLIKLVAGSFLAVVSVYPLWQADNHSRRSGGRKDNIYIEHSSEAV